MSLEEYRKKRDFRRTPEPAGDAEESAEHGGPLQFVVQKHAASHLHYDFRLELEGTLKSWAVPKGPSLDPKVRRLAMHVEDHPLDYGDFEGVIPEGEYGGGTVLLWDRGTWSPAEGEASAAYERGRLKFDLDGEKLQGRWNLVRMGGREEGGKESWLLIKERDAEAKPESEYEITEERPESVATGRVLEEIASDRDRVWHSNRGDGGGRRGRSTVQARLRAALEAKRRREGGAEESRSRTKFTRPAGSRRATTQGRARRRADGAGHGLDVKAIEGARAASLPRQPQAQLATLVTSVPAGDDWFHEIKFDGYRLLCVISKKGVRLISRNGKDWTDNFPGLVAAAGALPCDEAVLDGEAVVLDDRGISSFQALQNILGRKRGAEVIYYAFDLLHVDGYDLTGATLRSRKEALAGFLTAAADTPIRFSDHVEGKGRAFFEQACDIGVEGVISKRADCPYRPGRGSDWLKIKCLSSQEFVVVGFTDPSGSRKGFGSLLLGVNEDGRLVSAGRVGTGFTDRTLRDLYARLKKIERGTPPIANPPTGAAAREVHWVEPELVAEVEFAEWTEDDVIRHPSYKGLREDKDPAEVVREQPLDARRRRLAAVDGKRKKAGGGEGERAGGGTAGEKRVRESSPRRTRAARSTVRAPAVSKKGDIEVAGIRITNANRVLYTAEEITKGDVARYFEAVAEVALPYIRGRPLTLVRCPDGPEKPCFFQKHGGEGMPDVIPRVQVEEDDGAEPYMYIDELPSLIALVQFGVLEFHIWNARSDRLDRPDQIIFDLDPDEGLSWTEVVATALAMRDRLQELGLESFAKTTGGKGLHVVLPLVRRATWDDVRDFSRGIAEEFARAAPNRFTAVMSKKRRKGKIFIDFLRNARNSTAIAAYSTRSRPGAPVSVPVAWDELLGMRKRPTFDVRNVPDRVREMGDAAWKGFFDVRQSVTAGMLQQLG
jgi:bifunctional non-homologous end joining protein LigD